MDIQEVILKSYKSVENLDDYYSKDDSRYLFVGQTVCVNSYGFNPRVKCFGEIEDIYVNKTSVLNQPIYVKIAQTHDSDYRIKLGEELIVKSEDIKTLEYGLSQVCLTAYEKWTTLCKEYYYYVNPSENANLPEWICDKKCFVGVL